MVGATNNPLTFPARGNDWIDRENACEWRRWRQRRSSSSRAESMVFDPSAAGYRSEKGARLEAALFVAEGPLSTRMLCQHALLADVAEVRQLIDELNQAYDADDSAFRVERVASGFQLMTRRNFSYWLDQVHQRQAELKLSSPAMETLTIIGYRQPITRADVEAIRGVQCAEILKLLMDRGLVKIGGEDDSLGRPYLYVTTRLFLELFGLRSLDDLPNARELRVKPQSIESENVEDAVSESEADRDEQKLNDEPSEARDSAA